MCLAEITSTNMRIWAQTDAYERISGLCLQPHKRIHVLALTGIRVVTQDFGRKSKLKVWSLPKLFVCQAGRNSKVHCIYI
jgi:hypothetical protein